MKKILLAFALTAAGCTPELDDHASLVIHPEVVAIAASPAEASPKQSVSFSALYIDPSAATPAPSFDWAYCIDRKPLTEQGTVSPTCIAPSGPGLVDIGQGPTAEGPLPDDTCRLFGLNPPQAVSGAAPGRPVDPDPSGGFYQPVRLLTRGTGDAYAIGTARIACGIGGETAEQGADFGRRYRNNVNPAIASLALVQGGISTPITPDAPGADAGANVQEGESVGFVASWVACPTTPVCGDGVCGIDEDPTSCATDCDGTSQPGCQGSEQYLWFDPNLHVLSDRQESLTLTWFTTAGALDADRTGGPGTDAAATTNANGWTAPASPGDVRLWVVIRDDRGGVGWQSYRVAVK